ncbi:hypothetical protein [Niallia sp. NCCP-28]|uniref:hypothetical protein n=1 Tax=Niallia sp. NCCP-28 TaxID=2934712 RepID=UPI002088FDF1|nr:hypothetical protein [Niallia sp. NCCP-28]GKU80634.1 hypothetical protein NCCP28_00300 [Niallia sp. NCCP-28]
MYRLVGGDICGWIHIFGKNLLGLEYEEIGGRWKLQKTGNQFKLMRKCEEWAKQKGYKKFGFDLAAIAKGRMHSTKVLL